MIALYWQEHVVGGFHDAYFSSKSLYAANKMVPSLDNMDQVCKHRVDEFRVSESIASIYLSYFLSFFCI